MHTILKILFLLLLYTKLSAQVNLIPNPSFENLVQCNGDTTKKIANWGFTASTIGGNIFPVADTCANLTKNQNSPNLSRTGNNVGYFWTYGYARNDTMDRGYVYTPLTKILSAGKEYYFEMYLRLEDTLYGEIQSTFATNNQGAKFTNTCFCSTTKFANGIASGGTTVGVVNGDKPILGVWTKVAGCFNAVGDEKFVTIGNFQTDNNTQKQLVFPDQGYIYASYRIDDVSLYELDVTLPKDTAICVGDSVYVNAKLNNFTAYYEWSDGSTNPERYLKNAGIYKLKITPEGACKPIEKQIEIKYLPTRADWTTRDTNICNGDKLILRAVKDSTGTNLLWSDDSTNPEITITKSGLYWVRLKNNCIVHTDSINVHILDCGLKVYIPTAFSPNGDGINDFFQPFINTIQPVTLYKFDIFDKWGNQVYLSENINDKWDGKYHDHECNPGVYIWQLQFKVNQAGIEVPFEYSGEVTIIK